MLHSKRRVFALAGATLAAIGFVALAPRAVQAGSSAEQETVEEILQILADRGILSEAEHVRLATKVQTAKSERGTRDVAARLLEGLEWTGDLRLRYEAFFYDSDSSGFEEDNRYRFRYRARLGFKKKVNDRFTVGMRFSSGQDDNRSGNQTLGVDEDFDPDPFFIDRAYADIKLPEVGGLRSKVRAGKIGNPFVWSYGKDLLIVEKDVSLEGAALLAYRPLSERTKLFFHAGYFVADENSTSKDPKLFVAQLGGTTELSDNVEAGLRLSAWEWRSLDTDFIDRATDRGNLPSAFDSRARIGEVAAFAKLTSSDAWPLILYGTYVRNFTADSAVIGGFPVDEEDTAWSSGFEIGSSSRWAKLGVGYFHIEANSVVAQFTDSDLTDGFTNRRGWLVYVSRKLAPGVEFKLEYFDSDSIKNSPPFSTPVANGDRKRFRTDLVFTY